MTESYPDGLGSCAISYSTGKGEYQLYSMRLLLGAFNPVFFPGIVYNLSLVYLGCRVAFAVSLADASTSGGLCVSVLLATFQDLFLRKELRE